MSCATERALQKVLPPPALNMSEGLERTAGGGKAIFLPETAARTLRSRTRPAPATLAFEGPRWHRPTASTMVVIQWPHAQTFSKTQETASQRRRGDSTPCPTLWQQNTSLLTVRDHGGAIGLYYARAVTTATNLAIARGL